MVQIVVAAGLHLDRAWTQLGVGFGEAMRGWSRDALVRLVEAAGSRDAAALVIAGDLLDRATVVPDTVEYAANVLGAFPGPVLIVPGRSDWIGGSGPYDLDLWYANTAIWRSSEFGEWGKAPGLWISAWTNPAATSPRVPGEAVGGTLLRAAAGDVAAQVPSGSRFITTGPVRTEVAVVVPDLVHQPADLGGSVLVVDTEQGAIDSLAFPGQPGSVVELDVTRAETTDEFARALAAAVRGGNDPVVLRLVGELAPQVLLPGFGGPDLPARVVMDVDSLQFRQLDVDTSDRSARAEFVRAMAGAGSAGLERHQTIALGLVALAETATGA